MSDIYRKLLDIYIGKGGVKCYCCNWTKKNKISKKILRKMVRSKLKQYDRQYFKYIDENYNIE